MALAEADAAPEVDEDDVAEVEVTQAEPKPRHRPKVSKDTPRERREYDLRDACPNCGGELRVTPEACV